jgi:predicted DNA binding protein
MPQVLADEDAGALTGHRDVHVVLEIEPKGSCFMEHLDGEIADVALHFPGGDCQCDVTLTSENDGEQEIDIVHYSGDICEHCPGIVFREYNLVPRFIERTSERFTVRTYLPADHQLSELIADLREVSKDVRVLKVLNIRDSDLDGDRAEVDLSDLTDKQREALELATARGYYDSPPEVSQATLAEAFDVSESALSQRLARAEKNVLSQLFST